MVKFITVVNWIPWQPDEHHASSYTVVADKEQHFPQPTAFGMMHKKIWFNK
jgi:hypothetical protein